MKMAIQTRPCKTPLQRQRLLATVPQNAVLVALFHNLCILKQMKNPLYAEPAIALRHGKL